MMVVMVTATVFDEFNPKPLGVASLAQVHLAKLKDSDQLVAVKVQHPHLAEFADIDMAMVESSLGVYDISCSEECTAA